MLARKGRVYFFLPISLFPCGPFLRTAQSGEESILVASLRGVIAKQAAEIETLQSKLKELITTSLVTPAPATTSQAPQPAAKFAEVRNNFLSFRLPLSFPSSCLDGCGDMNLIRE